jgi:hypothetical protein
MTHRSRAASAVSCGNENHSHVASETLQNVTLWLAVCRVMLYDVAQEREFSHHLNQGTMLKTFAFILFAGAACSTALPASILMGLHGAALLWCDHNRA